MAAHGSNFSNQIKKVGRRNTRLARPGALASRYSSRTDQRRQSPMSTDKPMSACRYWLVRRMESSFWHKPGPALAD